MNKVKAFKVFLNESQLYCSVENNKILSETMAYIMDTPLNEKLNFMDKVKNNLSKNLLGSMSYINMIDSLVKKLADVEKETIKKSYDYEDEIDGIEIKIDSARRNGDSALMKTLYRQRERKIDESKKFMISQRLQMKRGIDLIEKAVGTKTRRKEYAQLKLSDKDYEIAEFTYEYAKKKSSDPKEINELKAKYEKARLETEKLVNRFKANNEPDKNKEIKIPKVESKQEKEYINSRDGSKILNRKKELENEISNLKKNLQKELSSIMKSIDEEPESSTKGFFSGKKKLLVALGNTIDASKNLLDIYKGLGNKAGDIDNKLKDESKFTGIVNKINTSILDGKDANSGTSKYISELFNKLGTPNSPNIIKGIIKKIA